MTSVCRVAVLLGDLRVERTGSAGRRFFARSATFRSTASRTSCASSIVLAGEEWDWAVPFVIAFGAKASHYADKLASSMAVFSTVMIT